MTTRLIAIASHNWRSFDGWCASRNVDPLELPLDRFLNTVYYWATRNGDEDSIKKFDRKLWIPEKGKEIPRESPWSAENETNAFKALKKMINPGADAMAKAGAATPSDTIGGSSGTPGTRGQRPGRG